MSVIDDYLASVAEPERAVLAHMYDVVRKALPEVTEETYYAMPAFKYHGQGLLPIMITKKFLSLYPYCNTASLGIDLSAYEGTKGSVHFTLEHPVSDNLLRQIIAARVDNIEKRLG